MTRPFARLEAAEPLPMRPAIRIRDLRKVFGQLIAIDGVSLDIAPGDVVVLPAGTGHQCLWAAPELCVIGAYPKSGKYNLCRGSKAEHAKALKSIHKVPLPATDPVHGEDGPLTRLWR